MRKTKLSQRETALAERANKAEWLLEGIQCALELGGTCCGVTDAAKVINGFIAERNAWRNVAVAVQEAIGKVAVLPSLDHLPESIATLAADRNAQRKRAEEAERSAQSWQREAELAEGNHRAAHKAEAALRAELNACQDELAVQIRETDLQTQSRNMMVHGMSVIRGILKAAGVKYPSGEAFEILKRFPPAKPEHNVVTTEYKWTVKR